MAGAAPLSFAEIQAWAELMDMGELEPLEVEGLIAIDAAFHAREDDETQQEESSTFRVTPAWPKRKG